MLARDDVYLENQVEDGQDVDQGIVCIGCHVVVRIRIREYYMDEIQEYQNADTRYSEFQTPILSNSI